MLASSIDCSNIPLFLRNATANKADNPENGSYSRGVSLYIQKVMAMKAKTCQVDLVY